MDVRSKRPQVSLVLILLGVLFFTRTFADHDHPPPPPDPYPLTACATGSWYALGKPGEGLVLEVLPSGKFVGYFFTWKTTGDAPVRDWYVIQGDAITGLGEFYHTTYPGDAIETLDAGDVMLTWNGVDGLEWEFHRTLDFDNEGPFPWCLGDYCTRSLKYSRLTRPIACVYD